MQDQELLFLKMLHLEADLPYSPHLEPGKGGQLKMTEGEKGEVIISISYSAKAIGPLRSTESWLKKLSSLFAFL